MVLWTDLLEEGETLAIAMDWTGNIGTDVRLEFRHNSKSSNC